MNQFFQARRKLYNDALPVLSKYFSKHINTLDTESKESILYANISNKDGKLGLVLAWPRDIFVQKVLPAYEVEVTPSLKTFMNNIGRIVAVDCDSIQTGMINFYVINTPKVYKMYATNNDKLYEKDLLRLTFDVSKGEVVAHKHYVNINDNEYSNKIYEIKNQKSVLVHEQQCKNDDGDASQFEDVWKLANQLDQTKYRLVGAKRSNGNNSYIAIKVKSEHEVKIAEENFSQ